MDDFKLVSFALRLISLDMVLKAKSGHIGAPLGCADLGALLYFKILQGEDTFILSNGHLKYKDQVGSIHSLAKALAGGAVNGWDMWLYKEDGKLKVIDELREKIRMKDKG